MRRNETIGSATCPADLEGVFIQGDFRAGAGKPLRVTDPSSGHVIRELHMASGADVELAVAEAEQAWSRCFEAWSPARRARLCQAIAAAIRADGEELVRLIAVDAGLPVGLAERDVAAAARYFEFYAAVADTVRGESIPLGATTYDFTDREPWGVCAVVLPFNFPLQLAARDLAPALAMGNAVVLKPAEQAPLAALALAALCRRAGAPPGLVNAVTGAGAVGEALIAHPDVAHITFTGSQATGVRVLQSAASLVKPVTLELGGKSPHVVFEDASIDEVVACVVQTTMRTAGQACSAGTRILVHRKRHAELVDSLTRAVLDLRVGPALSDPDVGPMISEAHRDQALMKVYGAIADGASLVTGGDRPTAGGLDRGSFITPTVLDGVQEDSPAEREEIFGPVLAVSEFETDDQAVTRANGTEYGLVAGVWTRDISRALSVARKLRCGQVFVNGYGVGSGVELPFGGYRRSGYGRVKGLAAVMEYSQLKNINIALNLNDASGRS